MLSIRSRLTVIFSVLSAVILTPLCIMVVGLVEDTIVREGERRVQDSLERMHYEMFRQWDDDFLVELMAAFGRSPDLFASAPDSEIPWAVIRGDGRVVRAVGPFADGLEAVASLQPLAARSTSGEAFRLLAAPLIPDAPTGIEDLPEAVREAVFGADPGSRFLRASAEWDPDETVLDDIVETWYEVEYITEDALVQAVVSESGRIVEEPLEAEFPRELPDGFVDAYLGGTRGCSCDSVSWTSMNGQLIAVWHGKDESGSTCARGANRLGESYRLDSEGQAVEVERESRLHLVVANDASEEAREIAAAKRTGAFAGVGAWVALSLVGWFVARVSMSPIRRIVDRVDELGDGLDSRIPVGVHNDEVTEIQATVNRMLDRIQEGIDRERQFLSNASHELRSPLAKLRAELDLALQQPRAGKEYVEILQSCGGYVGSMQHLVESLLIMARLDVHQPDAKAHRTDIGSTAVDVVAGFDAEKARRIRLEMVPSARPCVVGAEESLIRICLRNVLDNALRYSRAEEPVSLCVADRGGEVAVEVTDAGPGIPPALRRRVLDRFFRLDASRSKEQGGCGIGLALTRSICDACGGRIEIHEAAGGGTRVVMTFPVAADGASNESRRPRTTPATHLSY